MHDVKSLDRRNIIVLVSVFLAALMVRIYCLPLHRVISRDGIAYVSTAGGILQGNFDSVHTYGVVYPSLIAAVSSLGIGLEIAGQYVSVVMGSLLVIPLYLLAREFYSTVIAVMSCILVIAWPSLLSWSCEVMTQATYITLLVTWYWLLWQAYRRGSVRWSIVAGAVAGLSYLTRPESFVAFVIMASVLILQYSGPRPLKQRIIMTVACVGTFLLMMSPVLMLIHKVFGTWHLSIKAGSFPPEPLGTYLGRDLRSEPLGWIDVITRYPGFLWTNSVANTAKTFRTILPWFLWPAVLVGFWAGGWRREHIIERLYLLGSFAPLVLIIICFLIGPEYTQPYLPVLFLWTANGLYTTEKWMAGLAGSRGFLANMNRSGLVSVVAVTAMTMMYFSQMSAGHTKNYHFMDDGARYDQRRIGELLKKHLPRGARIMTRSDRIAYYAGMEMNGLPGADPGRLYLIAREEGVRYIVFDGQMIGLKEARVVEQLLSPLLIGSDKFLFVSPEGWRTYEPAPGLRLRLLYKDPTSVGAVVYEVMP